MNSKSNTQAMETEKVPRLLAQLAIPAVVAQVINLLNELRDKMGLTTLFIAHDLSVVKYFSGRIIYPYSYAD